MSDVTVTGDPVGPVVPLGPGDPPPTPPSSTPSPPSAATVVVDGPLLLGAEWRYVVLGPDWQVLTILDHLARDRTLTHLLGNPYVATGRVPSDSPEVNIISDADDQPFLTEGTRVLLCLRRDGLVTDSGRPWHPYHCGPIMVTDDQGRASDVETAFTSHDPWQWLFARPVLTDGLSIPTANGLRFQNVSGDQIVGLLLARTIEASGSVMLDMGLDFGGTEFYQGTIETTAELDIKFDRTKTVGEAWKMVMGSGTCDIVLTPIYDPVNRPGYCAEVSVYNQAGVQRNTAVFAWDKPSRSLTEISRLQEGWQRANVIQYFAGQGGAPVPVVQDGDAITKYGEWWSLQAFPANTVPAAVEALAAAQIELRKNGRQTVALTPASERSPSPLLEYAVGDRVPAYASANLRETLSGYQRIYGIPLVIDDNGVERCQKLLAAIQEAT